MKKINQLFYCMIHYFVIINQHNYLLNFLITKIFLILKNFLVEKNKNNSPIANKIIKIIYKIFQNL